MLNIFFAIPILWATVPLAYLNFFLLLMFSLANSSTCLKISSEFKLERLKDDTYPCHTLLLYFMCDELEYVVTVGELEGKRIAEDQKRLF